MGSVYPERHRSVFYEFTLLRRIAVSAVLKGTLS
jgi:hypothetical protein